MIKVAIIIGSTRPGRNSEAVAGWVHGIAKTRTDAEFAIVDIKAFNLPLFDKAVSRSTANTCTRIQRRGPRRSMLSTR